MGPLTDIDSLRAWMCAAHEGNALPYFRGHLALAADTSPAARRIAEEVAWLYGAGLVVPVQQRLGKHDYRYILQRTARSVDARRLAA